MTEVKRFIKFIQITNHTAEEMEKVVLESLKQFNMDIKNCPCNSYANTNNMPGPINWFASKNQGTISVSFLCIYMP